MDNDIIEGWRFMKIERQQKRKLNRHQGINALDVLGIPYATKNNGVHLILKHQDQGFIDYWPGTGKWYIRNTKQYKRGLRNLINLFKDEIK